MQRYRPLIANRANGIAVCCLLPFAPWVSAQANRSPSQLDAPVAEQVMNQDEEAARLTPGSPFYANPLWFMNWGPVTARPYLNTRFTYASSLRDSVGVAQNTVIESISPGALLQIGSKWQLAYTPTLTFYSSKEFDDTLEHDVALSGSTSYENWTFGLSQTFSHSSRSLEETGRQTQIDLFGTGLNATYRFNGKLLLQLGVNQDIRSAETFSSSRSWSTMNWLNYQISPLVSVGAGLGGGYQDVDLSRDMMFEQVQGRVDVRVSQKLTMSLNAGGELRQIVGAGGDPLFNPVFGASLIYRPFDYTTFSLYADRAVQASLFQGQINESTDISVAFRQRLLGILHLTLAGGFRNIRFVSTDATQALSREDDALRFSASLSYGFLKRGSIAIFYSHSENTSSDQSFDSSSNQVGLQLGYRF